MMDLQEIVHNMRSMGMHTEAMDISTLNWRLKKLAVNPQTADGIAFEKYLAWDIIQTMRRTLKCPISKSIAQHCEDVMQELEQTTQALASINTNKESRNAGE